MTQEKLDEMIKEIIIPQEKSLNTGNSHKRKQWEKQKYWRLCTIGESCKFGSLKDYDEVYNFYDKFNHWIRRFMTLGTSGRLAGSYYSVESHHFKKWSYNKKWLRKYAQIKSDGTAWKLPTVICTGKFMIMCGNAIKTGGHHGHYNNRN